MKDKFRIQELFNSDLTSPTLGLTAPNLIPETL
jgi:hypothetical protein